MLINPRRRRTLLLILLAGSVLLICTYNRVSEYVLTDEHRIYSSLLVELPRLERLVRTKQFNLSQLQSQSTKVEKRLTKYTWHLTRLIKTIEFNAQEQKRPTHFNPLDLHLETDTSTDSRRFLIYFHAPIISNDTDVSVLRDFHAIITTLASPYITFNESEAYLHVVYLPIRSHRLNTCYKDVIDPSHLVLYEFTDDANEPIDDRCFQGNFLSVKFFPRINESDGMNSVTDQWRWNDQQRPSIGIVRIDTNVTTSAQEYNRLKSHYDILMECYDLSCLPTFSHENVSLVSIICPPSYSIRIQSQFDDVFFHLLSQQIDPLVSHCRHYLPYAKVIDYFHPSSSLSWLYAIYFRTVDRRLHTLVAYLRTLSRLPTLAHEQHFDEIHNQLTRERNLHYLVHPRQLNFTQMPIGLMGTINFQPIRKSAVQVEPTFYDQWNRLYQPFFRFGTSTNPLETGAVEEKYTVVILTHKERFYQLNRLLLSLNGLLNLQRVIVLFNQIDSLNVENPTLRDFLGDYHVFLPSIHVEIVYVFNLTNNLNNRFLPWNQFIQTDAILSLDDDSFLRQDEIEFAFRVWREHRSRLVGFIARTHRPETFEYDAARSSCAYSMVLTGAAFIHRWYFDFYTTMMSARIRDYVLQKMNCEDMAMNFLVSHLTKQSPIRIGQRHTFFCYKCQESLSSKVTHYVQRTECLQYFANLYRSMPLRYSSYYVDFPSNMTSCFS